MCRRSIISCGALVVFSFLFFNFTPVAISTPAIEKKVSCREKVIVDNDGGGDDAIAILLLLEAQKRMKDCLYEIVAITCSYGNTDEKQVETNVRKTLTIANRAKIPIYAGATKPIVWPHHATASHVFGDDGLGNSIFDGEILGEVDTSKHASLAMIELSKTHSDLNILVLGPNTNVALAGVLDPTFFDRIKHIYVMGSSVAGVGNVRPGIEFNFASDPEANRILLDSTVSTKLTLFPWDTAVNSGYNNEWRKDALKGQTSKMIEFLDRTEKIALTVPTYQPVDVYTAAAMILGDKFVKKSLECNVQAVIDGEAKGGVLVDYKSQTTPLNAKIILSVDIEQYKKLYVCIFTGQNCDEYN